MKTFYHLPDYIIFDVDKEKCSNITTLLAAKYLKLCYPNEQDFNDNVLTKLESIEHLAGFCEAIKREYKSASPLYQTEIGQLEDAAIRTNAKQQYQRFKDDNKGKSKFLKKLANYVDNNLPIPETSTKITFNQEDDIHFIHSIKEYSLEDQSPQVHLNIKYIENLTITASIETLICSANKLKSIKLHPNLKELYCMHNQLENLELNEDLIHLQAQHNPLKYLKLNSKVKTVEISHNNSITEIDNSIGNNTVEVHYFID